MLLKSLAYVIIPVYTILFTVGSDWFTSNFSVIGNTIGRKGAFVIWGILVAFYYGNVVSKLIKSFPESRRLKPIVPAALILLSFAVTTPYLPNELPFKSFLHIVFAFVASVLLMLFLLAFTFMLMRHNSSYKKYFICVILIIIVSMLLLMLVGIISSALELFFTFSTIFLCQMMLKELSMKSAL